MPYPGLSPHRFAAPLFRIAPPEDLFCASVEVFGICRNRFPGFLKSVDQTVDQAPLKRKEG
jgi:hypothetical protein